tara:strand:- start:416 stop:1384 length:969 start_codon:yes stop_codon:yes gene_type:complete
MSQPKAITLSPAGLDRNGISTTETTLATRLDYLINGALSAGYDRNGIAAAQTNGESAALTLNGALGTNFRDRRGAYILIYAAGSDNTGITFLVVGEDLQGNYLTETITGPDNGLIVLGSTKFYSVASVTSSGAVTGNVEVGVNGYAQFSTPQHVAMYSAGNDTGDTYTARGYDRYGVEMTDSIVGANAGTSTTQDANFAWVDRITSDGASAGAVEAGVDALCESAWFVLNYRGAGFNVSIGCDTSGASVDMVYDMQHTFNDVLASGFQEASGEIIHTHDVLANQTGTADGVYTSPPVACRLAISTVSTVGTATARITQTGRP